jgi:PAS domain S-box-containing protein
MPQISGTYSYWLVALSFVIPVLTSYTAVDLAERVTANHGVARRAWLSGGAIAMGSGIWCMHYIGMLAFHMSMPVQYHIPTVVLSLCAAIIASFVALYVVSRQQMTRTNVILGSFLMGIGIAAMHYIGMASMRMGATPVYNVAMLAVSIVLAIMIAYVGLTLLFYMRDEGRGMWLKLLVALILGMAIPVMHYTGMAAASFRMTNGDVNYLHSVDISILANFAIFCVTGVILGFALITSIVDRRISDQHRILEDERKMLRALIDHIPDSMYVKDLEGRFILANIRAARIFGLEEPQRLLGKSDYDFLPVELAAKFRNDEKMVMLSGEALLEHEETVVDMQGNPFPSLTTKVPLRDCKGRVTGIAGVGRDISELKQSEAALRAAEQKYRGMFDEALVGIFKLRADGHLIHVNSAMAEFLGYANPEEMLALLTDPLWTLAVSLERQAEFMKKIGEVGYVKLFELEVFRNDGGKIWISCTVRAKYDGPNLTGFVGMFEDITERRILREQLLQAQKLESVGQLAAGIAHEINTPVQYIGDNVRFLRDSFDALVTLNGIYSRLLEGARTNSVTVELMREVSLAIRKANVDYLLDEIPKAIEQTLEGISRVAGLVGAMKEFSHPGTGEKIPLDLNHAIESTITVARNEWKYVAEIKLNLDENLPLVNCLPGEFNQVILNLVVNAAHAIADIAAANGGTKGLISVETRRLEGSVEIRIQDTGGGIPEKIRARIFDPFFTTKEIGKGTGQGLAIARSVVVDKHQGSIDFETVTGRGTTFIVRLPCEAAQPSVQTKVAA